MTHGAMVAIQATAAAAAAKARTQVLDTFRIQDATAPERARTLAEIGLASDDAAVRDLIAAGVLRGVDARARLTVLGDSIDRVAGFYLDEQAYIAHRDGTSARSSRQAVLLACSVVLVALGLAALAVIIVNRSR